MSVTSRVSMCDKSGEIRRYRSECCGGHSPDSANASRCWCAWVWDAIAAGRHQPKAWFVLRETTDRRISSHQRHLIMTSHSMKHLLTLGLVGLGAACSDSTGVETPDSVALGFRVVDPPPSLVAHAVSGPVRIDEVVGSNGKLTLTAVRLVINEAELKPSDAPCAGECAEFEAPPRFLTLPLDGTPVEAFASQIPAGTYEELDFEIEDLEDDEDEPGMMEAIESVRTEILSSVPDWPRKASAMVVGTFQPTGGDAEPFRVFLDAEIEIEFELIPPLVVEADGSTSRSIIVDVRPDLWFTNTDGSVMDLRAFDYSTTGELLELEVEMEEGFTKVEIDG